MKPRRHHLLLSSPDLHWTAHRKAEVLHRIRVGEITEAEACAIYRISGEELAGWFRRYREHGDLGLMVTKMQRGKA
jgi:hypothetical protein